MKSGLRNRGLLLFALALIAFDLALRVAHLRASSQPLVLASGLSSLEWQEPLPPGEGAIFYVVFQPGDCAQALKSLQLWNELQLSGAATVRGAMIDAPESAVQREAIVQRAGIEFPVARADTRKLSKVLRELGYSHTLVVIAVDRDGAIRLTMPAGDENMDRLLALRGLLVDGIDSSGVGAQGFCEDGSC